MARFKREAQACSQLRSPHTVTIFDFDETDDGVLYLAMELLQGRTLQQLQAAEGPLAPDRALDIIDQIADALAEAHALGIVHRDMKPENIVIETRDGEDHAKVLDFGIAKIMEGGAIQNAMALTAVGQTIGTLEFMSPEQLQGKPLDGRSDIYALGMIAYEMLTSALPFGKTKQSGEIIQFHLKAQAPAPSTLRPDLALPAYVDRIVTSMVAKRPEDRPTDAASLRALIQNERSNARAPKKSSKAGKIVAVSLLVLAAAAGAGAYFLGLF